MLTFLKKICVFLCYVYMYVYMYTMYLPGVSGSQKRAMNLWEVMLLTVLSCHVDDEINLWSSSRAAVCMTAELSLQPYEITLV